MRELAGLGQVRGSYLTSPRPNLDRLDIRDAGAVRRYIAETHAEVVLVTAADPSVDRCEIEPAATRRVNVEGVRNVADAARDIGATFVYFSSDYVFDGEDGPYRETDPVHPINEYGRQKVDAEELAGALQSHIVCRVSGVFGWEPHRRNFVCQVIDRLRTAKDVVAADDQVLCPTYAIELARVVRHLVASGFEGTIHVVGPEALTRAAFASRVAQAFGLDATAIRGVPGSSLKAKAPRPTNSALSDTRLRSVLGRGLPPLDDSLAAMRVSEARGQSLDASHI